jgi:YD repeat-containing protein
MGKMRLRRSGRTKQRVAIDFPVITSEPPRFATVGQLYSYQVTGHDPDVDTNDTLTFSLVAGQFPTGMSTTASGLVTWTPTADQTGMHTVTVRATDPEGDFTFQTYTIEVRATNTPPMFQSEPVTLAVAGETYRYQAVAIDTEYDPVGLLTRETHHGQDWRYTYDKTNQLTRSTEIAQNLLDELFAWDANGNPEGPDFVIGPGNRLLEDANFTYAYDAEGNLVKKTDKDTLAFTEYGPSHKICNKVLTRLGNMRCVVRHGCDDILHL